MAIAGAVLAVSLYLLGFHSDPAKLGTAQIVGTVGALGIGIVCITAGTKARRADIPAAEEFGYGRALGTGVMIALFASLFGIGTSFLYARVINPEFVDIIVQAQVQKLEARGMSGAHVEAAEKMIRMMSEPVVQAVSGFLGGVFFGTLISLVTAACLKRPAAPETFDDPAPPAGA
ncbi:MAG: DUF4199 domain-containing protein [Opitutus sp.]|nr:DUF4199 domain-containing protein [Opitutus sp.]